MHLFEFMDLDWLPKSLRATLRDILECGNSRPFRPYYNWVAKESARLAAHFGCDKIVELGAGTAPVTRHLLQCEDASGFHFVACDLNPDVSSYKALEALAEERVSAITAPIDFSLEQDWPDKALLVLSATLHHVPAGKRTKVLESLTASGRPTVIFEPLKRDMVSILFCFLSFVPALLTPVVYIRRPRRLQRFMWCWLLPLAPIMFIWDGVASCLRMWTADDWKQFNKAHLKSVSVLSCNESLFTQFVVCEAESSSNWRDVQEIALLVR